LCKILRCTRPSFALCNCCEKQIRQVHINEHYELLISQLHPLVDEINGLGNELNIIDMYWSSTVDQFILINENDFFLVNENIMSIEKRHTILNNKWLSCTCSYTSLFLSANELSSSIREFNFSSMIEFVQQWPCSFTHKKNE